MSRSPADSREQSCRQGACAACVKAAHCAWQRVEKCWRRLLNRDSKNNNKKKKNKPDSKESPRRARGVSATLHGVHNDDSAALVLDGANIVFSFGQALWSGLGMEPKEHGRPPLSSAGIVLALCQCRDWALSKTDTLADSLPKSRSNGHRAFSFRLVLPSNFVQGRRGGVCDGFIVRRNDSLSEKPQTSQSPRPGHFMKSVRAGVFRNERLAMLLTTRGSEEFFATHCSSSSIATCFREPVIKSVNRDRRGGKSFDDDVVVLREAVALGGGGCLHHGHKGFAISRDKFRDHWRKRSHEVGFHGDLKRTGAQQCKEWLAGHRIGFAFTTTVGPGHVTQLSTRDRWVLCRKLLVAVPSQYSEPGDRSRNPSQKNDRPALRATHAGVTVTVRFNLRPTSLQQECLARAGLAAGSHGFL